MTLDLCARGSTTSYPSLCQQPRPLTWAVDALSLPWEDLDPYAFPPVVIRQSGGETKGLPPKENHTDCSRVAQHAPILGSRGHVRPNPTVPAQSTHSAL